MTFGTAISNAYGNYDPNTNRPLVLLEVQECQDERPGQVHRRPEREDARPTGGEDGRVRLRAAARHQPHRLEGLQDGADVEHDGQAAVGLPRRQGREGRRDPRVQDQPERLAALIAKFVAATPLS